MRSKYDEFCQDAIQFLPEAHIFRDLLRCLTYGTDASFYRLIPEVVLKTSTEDETVHVLKLAQKHQTPVTFRAAGTSLSGQAVTDSILVMLDNDSWRDYQILQNGAAISLQPGIIGAQANVYLAPFKRKIGPDPASINTCKIGGIAANNASGMCCGTAHNSYQTLAAMRVILADGTVLDSGNATSRAEFLRSHSHLCTELTQLASKVRANNELADKIRHKFRIKNTTGYSLNALIDFEDPIDILTHLMIGSEGTLGFIANISYRTVVEHAYKTTTLALFANIESACHAVFTLKSQPVDAVELMDRASLRSVQDQAGMPDHLQQLDQDAAALLIDIRAETSDELQHKINQVQTALSQHSLLYPVQFSQDQTEYAQLWHIRKGLFPAVGAHRAAGTTVIIEDIAFPIESLAQGTRELQALLNTYHYHEAIIFGHALEGNLHFVFTQDFSTQVEIDRYTNFMHEVTQLVAVKFAGSLKAEHGTGRNMAPFVELEWGTQAYQIMWQIKRLLDPHNLLNPGVVLNENQHVHVQNLKPMPAADPMIDRCIECGFCESICPSRNLSLTPRQRIVAVREHARLLATGDLHAANQFASHADHAIDTTCAIDGLCATKCPVQINTGEYVRSQRQLKSSPRANQLALKVSAHMDLATKIGRTGLALAHNSSSILGEKNITWFSQKLNQLTHQNTPIWHASMPRKASSLKPSNHQHPGKVVYFPSCVSRTMGVTHNDSETSDVHQVMQRLLEKANYQSVIPNKINDLCCGMPFSSKGLEPAAQLSIQSLEESLWQASEQGRYPILCDTSPCTLRMIEQFKRPLKIYEPAGFIAQFLLSRLQICQKESSIALHISCSSRKLGLESALRTIAQQCAVHVFEPEEEGCCGFAGDKGFYVPELNAAALKRLKQQLPKKCHEGFSNSRTCEIGLSLHTERFYKSIVYLVDRCTNDIVNPLNNPS